MFALYWLVLISGLVVYAIVGATHN
jgi:hypothetical protein